MIKLFCIVKSIIYLYQKRYFYLRLFFPLWFYLLPGYFSGKSHSVNVLKSILMFIKTSVNIPHCSPDILLRWHWMNCQSIVGMLIFGMFLFLIINNFTIFFLSYVLYILVDEFQICFAYLNIFATCSACDQWQIILIASFLFL